MRQLHLVSDIDAEQKHGTCSVCGRVRLFFRHDKWTCTRRVVGKTKSKTGRALLHTLTEVDDKARTAVCAQCGPVRIYESKPGGHRWRVGQKWTCGRRPAERGIGGAPTAHQLTDIDPERQRAVCSICGPTQVVWRDYQKGGGRWGCVVTRSTMGRSSYKWKDDYKRAICPYCDHWHRWDRNQGVQCRERLVAEQNNRCAICDGEFTETNTPRVDHDHDTGKVRGALCRNCNVALGLLQDSPERVERAAAYLRR